MHPHHMLGAALPYLMNLVRLVMVYIAFNLP